MSDNEFDDIMKAMPSNISKLDSVYMCFKDEHDKWCDSIKNAYAENNDKGMGERGLVLSMHDGHWRTYLCPIDEARKLSTGLDFEAEA